jgi:hypothetical protein
MVSLSGGKRSRFTCAVEWFTCSAAWHGGLEGGCTAFRGREVGHVGGQLAAASPSRRPILSGSVAGLSCSLVGSRSEPRPRSGCQLVPLLACGGERRRPISDRLPRRRSAPPHSGGVQSGRRWMGAVEAAFLRREMALCFMVARFSRPSFPCVDGRTGSLSISLAGATPRDPPPGPP